MRSRRRRAYAVSSGRPPARPATRTRRDGPRSSATGSWSRSDEHRRGSFSPTPRWTGAAVTIPEAGKLLTYAHDRPLLAEGRRIRVTIYLVRHAKAGSRKAWTKDDDAPPALDVGQRPGRRGSPKPSPVERDTPGVRAPSCGAARRSSRSPNALGVPVDLSDALAEARRSPTPSDSSRRSPERERRSSAPTVTSSAISSLHFPTHTGVDSPRPTASRRGPSGRSRSPTARSLGDATSPHRRHRARRPVVPKLHRSFTGRSVPGRRPGAGRRYGGPGAHPGHQRRRRRLPRHPCARGRARRRRPRRGGGRARPTTAAAPAPRSVGCTAADPRR